MKSIKFKKEVTLTLYYDESASGGVYGYLHGVPGCLSQGESLEELKNNLVDAAESIMSTDETTLENM